MKKIITYGTFDLLHIGHINLLRRAKELGDYLIVGVTTENFDRSRGKLLVQQSLSERIASVRATGYADQVVLEEYEGQKIEDIQKYGVDCFAIGSDWIGKFDYLSDYCEVVYLPRTNGVSSTELRNQGKQLRLGVVGCGLHIQRFLDEIRYVSGIEAIDYFCGDSSSENLIPHLNRCETYSALLERVDAVYIVTSPEERPGYAKEAVLNGKHVLCETPLSLDPQITEQLYSCAAQNNVVLCEALKTAYSLAFQRLVLAIKSGVIGCPKSLEATCTGLPAISSTESHDGAMVRCASYVVAAAIKVFGADYKSIGFITAMDEAGHADVYTKIQMTYPSAEATLKIGTEVISEDVMIIAGTRGYAYVPAPWWKMDCYEIRQRDVRDNRRFFYRFEGEGVRYELAAFLKAIRGSNNNCISARESVVISGVLKSFFDGEGVMLL